MDEYVAQLERQPDGVLMAVLYRNGRRAHAELVRSVRQGRRRAHDLLCTAVDTAGRAFPGLPTDRQAKNPSGELSAADLASVVRAAEVLAAAAGGKWYAWIGS